MSNEVGQGSKSQERASASEHEETDMKWRLLFVRRAPNYSVLYQNFPRLVIPLEQIIGQRLEHDVTRFRILAGYNFQNTLFWISEQKLARVPRRHP